MTVLIGLDLALIQQPRAAELGDYDWFDIERAGTQVGKTRCRIEPDRFTVFSIMVYPEYEGHGYARAVIDHFKREYPLIIADRVRFTARAFWIKVGFAPETIDRYVWRREEGTVALRLDPAP
jgi:GNAT superfamily N-acetyltransferase